MTGLQIVLLLTLISNIRASNFFRDRTSKEGEFKEDILFNSGEYGVDASYPIHHFLDENSERGKNYKQVLEGCYKMYSKVECDNTEKQRVDMSLKQARTQHNYTEMGFKHRRLPQNIYEPLIAFFKKHEHESKAENWGGRGNTYVNHWDSPTKMISFEDTSYPDGQQIKQFIWNNIQPIIEEWVGRKVIPTSLYGIRIYTGGAVLAPHVDRLPLVSSCIVQVAQDVDEPWPIEVYSHDGKAYNVTMQPGDMVLYESSTVLHGRPFPLKGRFYANIFVHYEPVDHMQMNKLDREPLKHISKEGLEARQKLLGADVGGHEAMNHDEFDGSEFEADEKQTPAHVAARDGNVDALVALVRKDEKFLNGKDRNGWQPLHEAARGGHLGALQYLIKMGADVGSLTKFGGTALWWARRSLPAGHAVISFLEEIGAPELADKGDFTSEF